MFTYLFVYNIGIDIDIDINKYTYIYISIQVYLSQAWPLPAWVELMLHSSMGRPAEPRLFLASS